MKYFIAILLTIYSMTIWADCRGCCSHHGGVTCNSGITMCRDGSYLSQKCEAKSCNKCPVQTKQATINNLPLKKSYKRSFFSDWVDDDHNCLDTRQEILKSRSKEEVKISKSKSGSCRVLTGKWDDYYYNEVITKSKDIDIDHLVPLKHAWDSGASNWDQPKRDKFATDPDNLVITNKSYNRQKGAKTILEWMPVDRAYACRYTNQWFLIKNKYGLNISAKEEEYEKLLKCDEVNTLPNQ